MKSYLLSYQDGRHDLRAVRMAGAPVAAVLAFCYSIRSAGVEPKTLDDIGCVELPPEVAAQGLSAAIAWADAGVPGESPFRYDQPGCLA